MRGGGGESPGMCLPPSLSSSPPPLHVLRLPPTTVLLFRDQPHTKKHINFPLIFCQFLGSNYQWFQFGPVKTAQTQKPKILQDRWKKWKKLAQLGYVCKQNYGIISLLRNPCDLLLNKSFCTCLLRSRSCVCVRGNIKVACGWKTSTLLHSC